MVVHSEPVGVPGREVGVAFWATWLLANVVGGFVGLSGGAAFGLPSAWSMGGVRAGGVMELALAGAVLGLAQWLVLRLYLPRVAWWAWVPATALGMPAGAAVAGLVLTSLSGSVVLVGGLIGSLALEGALVAGVVGFAQWLVLRTAGPGAGWWVPACVLAGALFRPLTALAAQTIGNMVYGGRTVQPGENVGQTLVLAGTLGEAVALALGGLITGVVLARIASRNYEFLNFEF